jgi:hypothetical protein
VTAFADIAIGLTHTIRNKGNAMDELAEAETKTPSDVARAINPSDRHKLVADISVFHYKRLRMVAFERGIPIGELLEELIDRMWTYRSG